MNRLQRIRDHQHSQRLRDGTRVFLRPLRDADLGYANEFFARLSERTKYFRFMAPTPRLTKDTLDQLLRAMHEQSSAVVVALVDHGAQEEMIGGARIVPIRQRARATCEFALVIVDDWQSRGLGTVLLKECMRLAREHGYHHIEGNVLTINTRMLRVAKRLRFHLRTARDDASVTIVTRALMP